MSKDSSTVADVVVDLEKGTAVLKEVEKEEEVAIMDPRKAKLVNLFMNAVFVFYVLVFTGMVVWVGMLENSLWHAWLTFLCLVPFMIITFCIIPQLRKNLVMIFAMKRSVVSISDDLSAKLLASEK